MTTFPGSQRRIAREPRQAGRLVDLHADPMAEAMAELLPVPRRLDDRPRDPVQSPPGDPRPQRHERALLGPQDELVDVRLLVGDASGRERPACSPSSNRPAALPSRS